MPLPKRRQDESSDSFVSRCMSNDTMGKEYPDQKQRVAICVRQSRADVETSNIGEMVQEELVYARWIAKSKNMEDYVFLSKEEAEQKAKEMGLSGVHPHKTGTGKTVWMPGKNMDEFNKWYKGENQ